MGRRGQRAVVLFVAIASVSTPSAHAQDGAAEAGGETSLDAPVPEPPPAEPDDESLDFRHADASSTRVLLTPTAETHPDGTFFFNSHALAIASYELLVLQFGYAITDHVQLSLTGMPPLYEGQPYFFEGAVTGNVIRNDELRVAGLAAFDLLVLDSEALWGLRLGAIGTLCFGQTCQSNVSAGVATILNDDIASVVPFAFHLGVIARISEVVGLLAEPIFVGVLGEDTELVNAMILGWGVRLSGQRWGFDIGFMKLIPFEESSLDDGTILGWPVLSFTYRTDGSEGTRAAAPASPSPQAQGGTPRDAMLRTVMGF